MMRGTGRSSSVEAGAEPWLEQPRGFGRRIGPHLGDPRRRARDLDRLGDLRLEVAAGAGRTWIVISRATSDCQSAAEASTSITAPVVSEARNVMIATTATSARPAIELLGTIGVSSRGKRRVALRDQVA